MKKETLARILVILGITVAVAVPLAGRYGFGSAKDATIDMHARMPENGGWSVDHIEAQVGQTVHLRLTSDDVVHSFAIGQSDQAPIQVQPGQVVETTLKFDKPGKYTFYCTTWCGPNHWRMRGTIDVSGSNEPTAAPAPKPLFLQLGIDVDAPHSAAVTPAAPADTSRGAWLASRLPAYATDAKAYQTASPAELWQKLRAESSLKDLSDADLWNAVAWVWQNRTSPEKLADAQKLYATNCAACHGETGQGNGVIVRGLPTMDPNQIGGMGHSLVSPPDFTDPKVLLGASPALLEGKMIRGGMGTGMPAWGPILTSEQMDEVISYLYTFALQAKGRGTDPGISSPSSAEYKAR
jgi:mono/diheme cytochrome c family protein/plastocyanin